ncbi:unnamed protein product, partial [Iphiclides podalirius]
MLNKKEIFTQSHVDPAAPASPPILRQRANKGNHAVDHQPLATAIAARAHTTNIRFRTTIYRNRVSRDCLQIKSRWAGGAQGGRRGTGSTAAPPVAMATASPADYGGECSAEVHGTVTRSARRGCPPQRSRSHVSCEKDKWKKAESIHQIHPMGALISTVVFT